MFNNCPFEIIGEPKFVYHGKWLKTRQVKFKKSGTNNEQVWESAHRTTTPNSSAADGVDVIATLKKDNKSYFVFVKQFRIPINGFCLEFPAGLIDGNESIEEAGLRELKEETGYTATKVISCSNGKQGLDPGLTDDSVCFLTVEIDGDIDINRNPKQQLDDGEIVEVVLVECDKLFEYVKAVSKQVYVEAMVYSFAIGYSMRL